MTTWIATYSNRLKKLRIIAQCAVGYNNIDIECATKLGIYVTNTPEVLNRSHCRVNLGIVDATARRIVLADHFVRFGEW